MSKARDLADRHTRMAICSSSNVANGGFAAASFEAVPFATDVVDSASAFTGEASTDTNNGGVFTVPADGTYFIAVNQSVTCTTTNRLTQARLRLMLNTTGDIASDGGSEIQGTDVGTLVPDDSLATEFNCYTIWNFIFFIRVFYTLIIFPLPYFYFFCLPSVKFI